MMKTITTYRNPILIFLALLASVVFIVAYGIFVIYQAGTPNWLDGLAFFAWIILLAGLFKHPAKFLAQYRLARLLVLAFLGLGCIWGLLWALHLPSNIYLPSNIHTNGGFTLPAVIKGWATANIVQKFLALPVYFVIRGSNVLNALYRSDHLNLLESFKLSLLVELGSAILTGFALAFRITWEYSRPYQHYLTRPLHTAWRKLAGWRGWPVVRRLARIFLLIAIGLDLLGVALSASASQIAWESITTTGFPPGYISDVYALATSPDEKTIFAATDNGVFRSLDAGETWQPASQGLTSSYVRALEISPDGSTIYTGSYYGAGLSRSTDLGTTWQSAGQEMAGFGIYALAFSPDGSALYAGSAGGGIFRSLDRGTSWQPANQGLTSISVQALALTPGGEVLFAATGAAGIFSSLDQGNTWQPVNNGLTSLDVRQLAFSPDGSALFAGTLGGGVFRSSDLGASWQPVNQGLDDLQVLALEFSWEERALFAGTLGGGVFRSSDQGLTWRSCSQDLTGLAVNALAVSADGDRLLAGTSSGILLSADGGQTWRAAKQSPLSINVPALAVSLDGKQLFAGTSDGGVFFSPDQGNSWQPASQGLTDQSIYALAMAPGAGTLFARTSSGVFRSSDQGVTWQPASQGLAKPYLQSLLISPDGKTLFASAADGIFRSSDQGDSWQLVSQEFTTSDLSTMAMSPDGKVMLVGTFNNGIYRTLDQGASWQAASQGLTNLYVTSLAVSPNGKAWFAGTSDGVFRSSDQGNSWQPANQGLTNLGVRSLAIGPDSKTLFMATVDGVFRSSDQGDTWQPASPGLTARVYQLILSPDGEILFAGTSSGVARSYDQGSTWQFANQELVNLGVAGLTIHPGSLALFAGTRNGLYRSSDQGRAWQFVNKIPSGSSANLLAFTPDGNILFAGSNWYGIFVRSTDQGETWQSVMQGVTESYFSDLLISPDDDVLYLYYSGDIYRSLDYGDSWQHISKGLKKQATTDLSISTDGILLAGTSVGDYCSYNQGDTWGACSREEHSPLNAAFFQRIHLSATDGQINLRREDGTWLRAARYADHPPSDFAIWEGQLHLFAFAGAGQFLRASTPLPLLWKAPTPYLAAINATWQGIDWTVANPVTTLFGVLFLLLLEITYQSSLRPNHFRPATVTWLLPRPRHLLAASGYQSYLNRLPPEPLAQLVLYLSPLKEAFSTATLTNQLVKLGAPVGESSLHSALQALERRGLIHTQGTAWRLTDPPLAALQRREMPDSTIEELIEQVRSQHPIFSEVQLFLQHAGFSLEKVGAWGWVATSREPIWQAIVPLYVHLLTDRPLDLDQFRALSSAANQALPSEQASRSVIAVIDQQPEAGDLHQIFALRAQEGLTIIPLPTSLVTQSRLEASQAALILKDQVDLYTGRVDLYDIRSAVSDVLSFFGRHSLLAEVEQRLLNGRCVMIFGVRKAGKSSLQARLREQLPWPVAMLDLEGYTGNLGYVYSDALRSWETAIQADYPSLQPSDGALDFSTLAPAEQAQAFRTRVGTLLAHLEQQPGRPGLLLFLDEMDVLYHRPEYMDFAGALRSLVEDRQVRGRFSLLLAGLEPQLNRVDRLAEGRNPFFSFFGEVPLVPLDPDEASTMIVSIGGQMGIQFDDHALELLVRAGGGHPFLTRQLCSQAIKEVERPGRVDAPRAVRAVDEYLRQAHNYFAESLWGLDSDGPPLAEAQLMRMLAERQPQTDDELIPQGLAQPKARRLQLALDHLQDQSLIRSTALGWQFSIPLYRRWIRRYVLNLAEDGQ